MLGHLRGQRQKNQSCPLYRHDCDNHHGNPQKYTTEILASERKMVRLKCLEGIMIEREKDDLLMNDRNEQGRGGIIRITARRVQ